MIFKQTYSLLLTQYSDIAEESGLNYSEQGRIKEEFRLAKSLIEQADRSIKEAEQHVDENHDLQKDLQCERQCGKKLREAETQETLALVYKRTKLPLDIPWLKTFLPSKSNSDTNTIAYRFNCLLLFSCPCRLHHTRHSVS